jgi:hypothetical protein
MGLAMTAASNLDGRLSKLEGQREGDRRDIERLDSRQRWFERIVMGAAVVAIVQYALEQGGLI